VINAMQMDAMFLRHQPDKLQLGLMAKIFQPHVIQDAKFAQM